MREMLDVEPPAHLRARVVERIDARRASGVQPPAPSFQLPATGFQLPAFSFQRFAALSAAAVVVILILGLVLVRRAEPPAPVTARNGSQEHPTPGLSAQPPVQQARPIDVFATPPQGHLAPPAHPAPPARVAVVAAATTAANEQAAAVEPLSAITPIAVMPITPSSIAPDPIAVRPLNPITDLQITPLNPPDGRN